MTSMETILLVNAAIDLAIRMIGVARRANALTPEELNLLESRLRTALAKADDVTPRD